MTLEAAVDAVRRRAGLARSARMGAIGLGVGAMVAWLGPDLVGIALGLAALAGWWTRPSQVHAAAALDTAVAADGAVLCAWDHRKRVEPMAEALRARVEARLTEAGVRAAAPAPAKGWALLPLLWLSLLVQASPPEVGVAGGVTSTDAGVESPVVSVASVPSAGRPAPAADAGARAVAGRAPPDAGVTEASDGGGPGGAMAGRAEVGGEGTRAGDQRAMPVAAERVGLSPGTAAGLWLARAGGEAVPVAAARAVSLRGRTPAEDDISDPARPFSPRYRPLIEAWFRRSE